MRAMRLEQIATEESDDIRLPVARDFGPVVRELARHLKQMNGWERRFIESALSYLERVPGGTFTPKQRHTLADMERKYITTGAK